jgi:peptide/nickel transport system permease protein
MRALRFLRGGPFVLGAALTALLALAMTLAPQLFTQRDPGAMAYLERLRPPSLAHPLGTDESGRDLWARLVYGARPTLTAALGLIGLSLIVGSLLGLVIGAAGRRTDEVLMRVTELFLAFPQIIWALALTSVLGRGLFNCVLALTITWWAQYARLMRGQVLAVREREFVLASRALGQREWSILLRHLLPTCCCPRCPSWGWAPSRPCPSGGPW